MNTIATTKEAREIKVGLTSEQKYISSKFFYDKLGDEIFIEISQMPEYYLYRAEDEIFRNQTAKIISWLRLSKNEEFDLIELGSGDGSKTRHLFRALIDEGHQFTYKPIDISSDSLFNLSKNLQNEFNSLKVETINDEYFSALQELRLNNKKKVILFLGSNLGNLNDEEAKTFLSALDNSLKKGDRLILGLDLIKSKDIVLPAYNDKSGITARFNLNLLRRINREYDADFILDNFEHLAEYNEGEGIVRSYLVSNKDHDVSIAGLNLNLHFKKDEKIHTEISRKYKDSIVDRFLIDLNLHKQIKLMDSKEYFAEFIIVKT